MPKLSNISGAEAVRALESLGFEVKRQKGSHIVLRRGSSGCVVPNHREIKVGTLAGILRQAGVTAEEFINEYATQANQPPFPRPPVWPPALSTAFTPKANS